jgi:hypothetical protein
MSIKTGRYGDVMFDPTGVMPGTPVSIISLNKWKADFKTAMQEVTCFGDGNKVYVPGLKDVKGTISGFWNSDPAASPILFNAADSETPGILKLVPNKNESAFYWEGLSYMDASIDCSVDGAPAISGDFSAAGPWTFNVGP